MDDVQQYEDLPWDHMITLMEEERDEQDEDTDVLEVSGESLLERVRRLEHQRSTQTNLLFLAERLESDGKGKGVPGRGAFFGVTAVLVRYVIAGHSIRSGRLESLIHRMMESWK